MKGINREKSVLPNRKLPITPDILGAIKQCLRLQQPCDLIFWSTCLLAFFGMLRKSNLLPSSYTNFDHNKHFVRGDLAKSRAGLTLKMKWSKTIQFKERCVVLPLPCIPGHPLCPVTAITALLLLDPSATELTPLLSYPTPSGLCVYTQSLFTKRLRSLLSSLGLPSHKYSGHSFRRGGASWAFQSGLPGEVIQILGDWKSNAYKDYLSISTDTKFHFMSRFSLHLPH